jgi:putrescine transport system permease protein
MTITGAKPKTPGRLNKAPGARTIESVLRKMGVRPRLAVVLVPYLWLTIFFLTPFAIVLWISTAYIAIAMPPYTHYTSDGHFTLNFMDSYGRLFQDELYFGSYLNSLVIATVSTILCLLIGYPMAYGIARCKPSSRRILLMMIILPFWTSFLIRVYAWMGLLKNNGVINNILMWLHLVDPDHQIVMMNTQFSVYVGIVYSYLPFMILPLYANLEKMDLSLLEAAADLGCRPLKRFFVITVPLSFPGIVAGSMLVFIPAVGEYVIPELLGGSHTQMIGRTLYNEFFANRDWATASAVAVAILLLLVVPLAVFQRYRDKEVDAAS